MDSGTNMVGDGENGAGNKELTGVAAKGQGSYFSGKKGKDT